MNDDLNSITIPPCPCCWFETMVILPPDSRESDYKVQCLRCGLEIGRPDPYEAVAAWSKRAEPPGTVRVSRECLDVMYAAILAHCLIPATIHVEALLNEAKEVLSHE